MKGGHSESLEGFPLNQMENFWNIKKALAKHVLSSISSHGAKKQKNIPHINPTPNK